MPYGIYYAYWERQWGGDYLKYPAKVGALGFDILEISCASLAELGSARLRELRRAALDAGIGLTGGYGPRPRENLASPDGAVRQNGFECWASTFAALETLGVSLVGGGLYSYWPVDFSRPFDKAADLERSVESMKKLAGMAADHGITLAMEALNRFEGCLINTAAECLEYVKAVDRNNVKVMLDTFHMNIEEDSIQEAIKTAGDYLGHFHIGEANRRPPRPGGRINWREIAEALGAVNYRGPVVMEPFVLQGGQVGSDIKVWRDLSNQAGEADLDNEARRSLSYIKAIFGNQR
jgi:D-psicose/D-tagatose/L-ribulose 3-epimerase